MKQSHPYIPALVRGRAEKKRQQEKLARLKRRVAKLAKPETIL